MRTFFGVNALGTTILLSFVRVSIGSKLWKKYPGFVAVEIPKNLKWW